jgi:hypothetical protein
MKDILNIGRRQNLEDLTFRSASPDSIWPTMRWSLPELRLVDCTSRDGNGTQFLTKCQFPSLVTLHVDIRRQDCIVVNSETAANLREFLKHHPSLLSVALEVDGAHLPLLLPLICAHELDLGDAIMSPKLVHSLSPSVHKLKIVLDSDPAEEETGTALDLLKEGLSIEVVQCRLSCQTQRAGSFSWSHQPKWFVEEEEDPISGYVISWDMYSGPLESHARRLQKHGIRLCDSQGQTIDEFSRD